MCIVSSKGRRDRSAVNTPPSTASSDLGETKRLYLARTSPTHASISKATHHPLPIRHHYKSRRQLPYALFAPGLIHTYPHLLRPAIAVDFPTASALSTRAFDHVVCERYIGGGRLACANRHCASTSYRRGHTDTECSVDTAARPDADRKARALYVRSDKETEANS